jgi:hypothetical protein
LDGWLAFNAIAWEVYTRTETAKAREVEMCIEMK